MRFLGYLCAFSLVASAAVAQQVYIVELTGTPAGRLERRSEARASVHLEQARARRAIARRDTEVLAAVDTVANALIMRTTSERAAEIAKLPGVRHVHASRIYKPALDHAVGLQKVTDAWAQLGGFNTAGTGMKIGIIDTGIDVDHPGFQDASLPAISGFPLVNRDTDMRFTNNKIIVARSYDNDPFPSSAADRIGHGTAVAMVAAGATYSTPAGVITGIAPKAYLGNYKVFPDAGSGAPSELIIQALDDAVKDGMDVVNMSLGSSPALAIGRDPLVEAVENATAAGVIVAIAAGNSGPDPNTIESPGSSPDAITVGNAANDRVFSAQAAADDGRTYRMYPGSGDNSSSAIRGRVADVAAIDTSGLACTNLPDGSLSGRIALILRGDCPFETKLNNAASAGALAAVVYTNDQPVVTMSVGSATLPAALVTNEDGLDIKAHVAADPNWVLTLHFDPTPLWNSPAALSRSSSRGPSVDHTIKPDLLGVGSSILTAAPLVSGPGFAVFSGTSLSAPMVTGAAALLKAARPGYTARQYRSLLINSAASLNPDVFDQFSTSQVGAGLLNVSAALNSTVAAFPPSLGFGTGAGTVDLSRTVTFTNLGSSADTISLSAVPFQGSVSPEVGSTTLLVQPGESRDTAIRFHAGIPAPGQYQGYISVRSSLTGVETRIPYWYGVPSGVPANITLLRGPEIDPNSSRSYFLLFRVTDSSGIAIRDGIDVTVESGSGRVTGTTSLNDDFPGVFEADVRSGGTPTVIRIQAGDRSALVSIPSR